MDGETETESIDKLEKIKLGGVYQWISIKGDS